ncbi:MAG: phosphonate metabolism protein/1,5-bisphosphokinase (PRPP-forming) PhnN [Pseudolabrys sp.]
MSEARRIGPGRLVLVVGPSGAGKDTLIAGAKGVLANDAAVTVPRRVVTRISGNGEDHDTLTPTDFDSAVQASAFSLYWGAHGLRYGIPRQIDDTISAGSTVVCNVSRTVIDAARERYARVTTVLVTAPPDVLARRLAGRSRASDGSLTDRLARQASTVVDADVVIDNVHAEADGIRELVHAIKNGSWRGCGSLRRQ